MSVVEGSRDDANALLTRRCCISRQLASLMLVSATSVSVIITLGRKGSQTSASNLCMLITLTQTPQNPEAFSKSP